MPRRKIAFLPNHYYHIYNRGIDKRPIFQEEANYIFLLRLLKKYGIPHGSQSPDPRR
ncbi:MAG: hypothetical protein GY803_32480 [Chloroflexi bacterium]|nr:hypothetical protein [Chloroflexota bacterium]